MELSGSGGPQTAGESYTLTCTASGGGDGATTYQWHSNGALLNTQTSQTLTFSALREDDNGRYTCTVTRGTMTIRSAEVGINVGGMEVEMLDLLSMVRFCMYSSHRYRCI